VQYDCGMIEIIGDTGRHWQYDDQDLLGPPGGFGAVYRGQDDQGNAVAIKVIQPSPAGDLKVATILRQREVDIYRAISQRDGALEHLLAGIDFADDGASTYIVMEIADYSLRGMISNGRLEQAEATNVLIQSAHGLRDLHQCAVIHRDIKPDNVLSVKDVWKLADFGIARDQTMGTQNPTFVGVGTWRYMAPELWNGASPTVETDLYALGCLAFELLAGSPPFLGPDVEDYRRQHLQSPPPDLPAEVAPALRQTVMRLLRKAPNERYQDARAVIERLERLSLPLSDPQKNLLALSAKHARERSQQEAAHAAAAELARRVAATRQRGWEDLAESAEEGTAAIQAALPDVRAAISRDHQAVTLEGDDARLEIALFGNDQLPTISGDPILLAGHLHGRNRRCSGGRVLGNIVYEEVDGRYAWQLYTFMAQVGLQHHGYRLGPDHRPHGFSLHDFVDQRPYMLQEATHIWTLQRAIIVPGTWVDLYASALALPE
jgi:hypothetical protein